MKSFDSFCPASPPKSSEVLHLELYKKVIEDLKAKQSFAGAGTMQLVVAADPEFHPDASCIKEKWAAELCAKCWSSDSSDRPPFRDIIQYLKAESVSKEIIQKTNMPMGHQLPIGAPSINKRRRSMGLSISITKNLQISKLHDEVEMLQAALAKKDLELKEMNLELEEMKKRLGKEIGGSTFEEDIPPILNMESLGSGSS